MCIHLYIQTQTSTHIFLCGGGFDGDVGGGGFGGSGSLFFDEVFSVLRSTELSTPE